MLEIRINFINNKTPCQIAREFIDLKPINVAKNFVCREVKDIYSHHVKPPCEEVKQCAEKIYQKHIQPPYEEVKQCAEKIYQKHIQPPCEEVKQCAEKIYQKHIQRHCEEVKTIYQNNIKVPCEEIKRKYDVCFKKSEEISPPPFQEIHRDMIYISYDSNDEVIRRCSVLFYDSGFSYGRTFDFTNFNSLPYVAQFLFSKGKKYIFSFLEIEPNNWVFIYCLREAGQNSLHVFFPKKQEDYNNFIFNFDKYFTVYHTYADIYLHSFNTLVSSILLAYAVSLNPDLPIYSVSFAKNSWNVNHHLIYPLEQENVEQEMTDFSKDSILSLFTLFIYEDKVDKIMDIPVVSTIPEIFEEENNMIDSMYIIDESSGVIIPGNSVEEIQLNYPKNMNNEMFIDFFPKFNNGNSYCVGNSTASLGIFVGFLLGHKIDIPSDLRMVNCDDIISFYFMEDAIKKIGEKYSGGSSKIYLSLCIQKFISEEIDSKYIHLQSILSQIKILPDPKTYDENLEIIPINNILDYIPDEGSIFGIHIENDISTVKSKIDLRIINGKRLAGFIFNQGNHYMVAICYIYHWFLIDDITGMRRIYMDDVNSFYENASFILVVRE